MMKDATSGSKVVFECKSPTTGSNLVAIGYKYNSSKVLCFLATKNAGSTKNGEPYIAKFPDKYGNVNHREVERPEVISVYFQYSDVGDSPNQARQLQFALEEHWVTHDGFFRNCTKYQ